MRWVRASIVVLLAATVCLALSLSATSAGEPETKSESKADDNRENKPQDAEQPQGENKPAVERTETRTEDDGPLVITNEILEQMFGGGSGTGAVIESATPGGTPRGGTQPAGQPAQPGAQPDPLEVLRDQQARERSRKEQIAEAQKEVAALEERIKTLERRELAVRNPFLARPQIPDDERDDWNSMTAPERVARTQDDVAQAKAELEEARNKLAKLQSGS